MAFIGVIIGAIAEELSVFSLNAPLSAYPWTFGNGVFLSPYWGLFGMVYQDYQNWTPAWVPILLASIAAFLVTGAGNVLNDYYDYKLDKKAHPERPIPSGEVSPKDALTFAMMLFTTGILITILINWMCVMIAILNTALLFQYEKKYKAKGLSGNVIISYLTASVFLFGGASVLSFKFVPIFFLLALFANVGREITKDIEDMKADAAFRKTLPLTSGKKTAAILAIRFVVAAVVLSFLPLAILIWAPVYLGKVLLYLAFVIVADIVFIYSCTMVMKNPGKAQSRMKDAMIIAMLSFFAIGLMGLPGPGMRL
jgi:geranylgeranylglycerol-phosphate geranylgeranyltransferase